MSQSSQGALRGPAGPNAAQGVSQLSPPLPRLLRLRCSANGSHSNRQRPASFGPANGRRGAGLSGRGAGRVSRSGARGARSASPRDLPGAAQVKLFSSPLTPSSDTNGWAEPRPRPGRALGGAARTRERRGPRAGPEGAHPAGRVLRVVEEDRALRSGGAAVSASEAASPPEAAPPAGLSGRWEARRRFPGKLRGGFLGCGRLRCTRGRRPSFPLPPSPHPVHKNKASVCSSQRYQG